VKKTKYFFILRWKSRAPKRLKVEVSLTINETKTKGNKPMALNGQTTVDDVSRTAKTKAREMKDGAERMQGQITEVVTEKARHLADQLQDLSHVIRERAGEARERTTEAVSRHPFYSVGAAAVVGMAVGYLFSRRR
jgi:ElaB/YqjD/DUF883 family membrane-anchored ribosome-binding protein